MKRTNEKKQTQDFGRVDFVDVQRVRDTKTGVWFTLILNGVTINNCHVVEGKNGDFIGLPSYKGTDDKYYNTVYFKFTPEDNDRILEMIEAELNK